MPSYLSSHTNPVPVFAAPPLCFSISFSDHSPDSILQLSFIKSNYKTRNVRNIHFESGGKQNSTLWLCKNSHAFPPSLFSVLLLSADYMVFYNFSSREWSYLLVDYLKDTGLCKKKNGSQCEVEWWLGRCFCFSALLTQLWEYNLY